MSEWRGFVCETLTGAIVDDIALSDRPKFSRKLNDKGSWTFDIRPDEKVNRDVDFNEYVTSRFSWVVAFGDFIVQAGPVWTHNWDDENRMLSVSGTGMGGMFERRVLRNPAGPPDNITHTGNDLSYNNLSLRGIMRHLVADNMTQTGYGLPIDVGAEEAGTHERNYMGYDLAMVWQRMEELSQVIDGPEFDFYPYFLDGVTVRWEFQVGGPLLGNQDSENVWDYGGALSGIDTDVNGSVAPARRAWVKGSGSERDMVSGYAEDASHQALGYPAIDYVDNDHTSVEIKQTAEDYADADILEFATATEKWECSVRIDGLNSQGKEVSSALGNWDLGDRVWFGVNGHPRIAKGMYQRRILGYSDSSGAEVALEIGEFPTVGG